MQQKANKERKEGSKQMRNKNKTLDLKTLVVFLICTATTCLFGTLTVPNQPVLRPMGPMGSVGACLAGGKRGDLGRHADDRGHHHQNGYGIAERTGIRGEDLQ